MKVTKLTARATSLLLLSVICCVTTTTLLAQTRSEVSVRSYALVSPVVALIAGILILIVPRLLNYIVALYLIVIGLIGIFGR